MDNKNILFFYNQEDQEIFCEKPLTDEVKQALLQEITNQAFPEWNVKSNLDYKDFLEMQNHIEKVKEDYDSREHEFPNIQQ